MGATMWAERRAPSAPTWLLILALHAGVLALLNTRTRLAELPRTWSEIRLVPERPAQLPQVPRAPEPVWSAPAVQAAPPTVAPSLEDTPAATPIEPPATTELPAPAPAPLRLTLPDATTATRQHALDDLRGNTPVSRIGARIAHDLGGDGRWVEERMEGSDFVRLRRGNTCINLHRNSGVARERFNESVSPTLWGATPAYRCERR